MNNLLLQGIKPLLEGGHLINCTPHPLNFVIGDETFTLTPSGVNPRVSSTSVEIAPGVIKNTMGEVTDLPEPEEGKLFIVSAMVKSASKRNDLVAPNTGAAIRNDLGHIIGVPGIVL